MALEGAFEIGRTSPDILGQEDLKGLATSYWEQITSSASGSAPGLSALFWGRKAVEWLTERHIPIPASIRSCSQQAAELAVADMKAVEVPFEIGRTQVNDLLNAYSSQSTAQDRLAFVVSLFHPVDIQGADTGSSVLMNIISHCSILPEGGAAFGEGELSWSENNFVSMTLNYITLNFDFLFYYSSLSTDFMKPEILKEILGLPLFPRRLSRQFTEGFFAFLHGDFRTSTLFLAPVFEASIRQVFILLGKSTLAFKPDTQEVVPLNSLLDSPLIKKIYGEELLIPWRYIFTSKRGLNIRNEFAHGLNSDTDCNLNRAALVWGYLLHLLLVTKFEEIPQPQGNAS